MSAITSAIAGVTIGIDVTVQNLTMFPLLGRENEPGPADQFLTLDEALSGGWARITEVSEQGSVPELRVSNTSDAPVFILDGEELIGAKQNRVVNLSILVPPRSVLKIPVSCVEAGRWHARSRTFAAAPRVQFAAGRARKMQQVTASMMSHGARMADQCAVWDDIAQKSARMQAHSPTSAMEAMFVSYEDSIEKFVAALLPAPGQTGALFAVGERVAGFELFATAPLLRKLLPKIVRSYALDAIDDDRTRSGEGTQGRHRHRRRAEGSLRVAASQFLDATARVPGKPMSAIGFGVDVRIHAPGVTAAALVHDDRVVHLGAFAA
ncbi:MAG TPA: DUF6569 family protein [Vicinamibacterales bacterium]|nr:DUF6569 family protein [Vicinamibacterales bacterium]